MDELLSQFSIHIFDVNTTARRILSNICVAELDGENDGLLSSAEFAEMAKLAQVGRHELQASCV
jgi:hypothetical protein